MKIIETQRVYHNSDESWQSQDGRLLKVARDDSNSSFHALLIDGEQFLIISNEPYLNDETGGLDIGFECFKATPGVQYVAFVDEKPSDEIGVIERYSRNGITILGFKAKIQEAEPSTLTAR